MKIRPYLTGFMAALVLTGCGEPAHRSPLETVLKRAILADDFGVAGVGSICFLENGDLAILDNIVREVLVFRGDSLLQRISAIGSGPLEYTSPTELAAKPGGGFVLNCHADEKMLVFDADYVCRSEILFTGFNLMPGTPVRLRVVSDSLIVGVDYIFDPADGCGTRLSSWDVSDPRAPVRLNTYHTRLTEDIHPVSYIAKTAIVFDVNRDEGVVYFADASPEASEIRAVSLDNRNIGSITFQADPIRKTDEEIEEETLRLRNAWIRGTGSEAGFTHEPSEFHNTILSLNCTSNGNLWVRRGTHSTLEFDVYGQDLHLLNRLVFTVPDTQRMDGWLTALSPGEFAAAPFNPQQENVIYKGSLL
jgi:hypothetical protein